MNARLQRISTLNGAQWWVVATSVVLLPPIQVMLKTRGLKRTALLLAEHSDRSLRRNDQSLAVSTAEAVALVAGRKVVGALCLGRSLLLWFLLRRRGMDAVLVVGSMSAVDDEWMAHAWVELDDRPVNDAPDVAEHYVSFGLDLPRLRAS
jgi:hypothetical protein